MVAELGEGLAAAGDHGARQKRSIVRASGSGTPRTGQWVGWEGWKGLGEVLCFCLEWVRALGAQAHSGRDGKSRGGGQGGTVRFRSSILGISVCESRELQL